MGTFVPTEGEVLDFEVFSLSQVREALTSLSGEASFSPLKMSSGAVWWVCESFTLPHNERARKWMDISEIVRGPAAYISPQEVRKLEASNPFARNLFDGEPMVKLAGNVFPVRKTIINLGGIRHAEDNQWWVPKGVLERAKEIVKNGKP